MPSERRDIAPPTRGARAERFAPEQRLHPRRRPHPLPSEKPPRQPLAERDGIAGEQRDRWLGRGRSAPCASWRAARTRGAAARHGELDQNETDDPRAWALDPGVARALRVYHKHFAPEAEPSELVFIPRSKFGLAETFGSTWSTPA